MFYKTFSAIVNIQLFLEYSALPFKHAKVCNNQMTFVAIEVIGVVAVLLNLFEALDIHIKELPIYTSWFFNESLPSTCIKDASLGLIEAFGDPKKANFVFFIFSGLLCRVFPVVVLLVSTIALAFLECGIICFSVEFPDKKIDHTDLYNCGGISDLCGSGRNCLLYLCSRTIPRQKTLNYIILNS